MKFTINTNVLKSCLARLIGVIPGKVAIPILENILLEANGKKLRITATDLETSILTHVEMDMEKSGAVAIPAKRFFEIVRELPDCPLVVTVKETKIKIGVMLETDKGEYKITGEPSTEFPALPNGKMDGALSMPTADFMRMVEKTIFAVSDDELRPGLTGVCFEIRKGELRLVATDGHRLSKFSDLAHAPEKQNGRVEQIIVPVKALSLLAKNASESESLDIAFNETHIVFGLGDTTIYSKLVAGKYPNYERVIPQDNEITFTADRQMLLASLRRVRIFSNETNRLVRINLEKDLMRIVADSGHGEAEAEETVPIHYDGDAMEIGYNSKYLIELLRTLEGDEVLFRLKEPGSAAVIEPVVQREGENVLLLQMPVNLNASNQ